SSMTWSVLLSGEPLDLEVFENAPGLASSLGWTLARIDGALWLRSPEFETFDDPEKLHSAVASSLAWWNGAAQLLFECGRVGVKGMNQVNERGRQTATQRFDFHVRPALTPADLGLSLRYLELAKKDANVQKVLRLLSYGPLDWVSMYCILEVIGKDVGGL